MHGSLSLYAHQSIGWNTLVIVHVFVSPGCMTPEQSVLNWAEYEFRFERPLPAPGITSVTW
jgi:hypothetical protein